MTTCINADTPIHMDYEKVECIITGGRTLKSIPIDVTPIIIIKYGPTGSGKGSAVVTKQIEALGIPLDHYLTFEVDSVIESVASYKRGTVKIRVNRNSNKMTNTNMYRQLKNLYFATRKAKNYNNKSINSKIDTLLERALKDRKNIIFETTGSRYDGNHPFKWLLDLVHLQSRYKIVVIYPFVGVDDLKARVVRRAESQYANPIEEKKLYRAVDPSNIAGAVENSQRNFKEFIVPDLFSGQIDQVVGVWNT